MSKNYNSKSNSDMKQFAKDMLETSLEQTKEAILQDTYEVPCPYCNAMVFVPIGKTSCPNCHKEINLTLNL